ncbi:hypothetical protein ASC95_08470 [Pelomonas sp. Root1217]|nr:hypothetical protein ASC95_08470 [Pelomonas sp. Root1217]
MLQLRARHQDDRLMAHFGVSRPSDVEPPESAFPGLKAFFIRAEDKADPDRRQQGEAVQPVILRALVKPGAPYQAGIMPRSRQRLP